MVDLAVGAPVPAPSTSLAVGNAGRVPAMDGAPGAAQPLDGLASLVRIAVQDDDVRKLLGAAASALGVPLGVAAMTGEPLAHAPDDALGHRALTIAATAARENGGGPPRGWHMRALGSGGTVRATLAVGVSGSGPAGGPLLDAIVDLLGEQLLRADLRRSQVAALLRRLVDDPGLGALRARDEAAALGLTLPDPCWPALVAWSATSPRAADLEGVAREARQLVPGSMTATASGHMVLLHPAGGTPRDTIAWMELVVARLRALAPSVDARALAADGPVALGAVATEVAGLLRLSRYPAPPGVESGAVTRARQYALDILLRESVAPGRARMFVDDLLGALIAWDREHGSDLLQVLEAALDSPRHDVAARRCFMHRNTFRHRFQRALEVLGDDLTDPETRLAVHVALKLRHATASRVAGDESAAYLRRRGAVPPRARRAASA